MLHSVRHRKCRNSMKTTRANVRWTEPGTRYDHSNMKLTILSKPGCGWTEKDDADCLYNMGGGVVSLPFSFRPRQNCLPDRLAIMTWRNPTADARDEMRKSDSNNTHPPRLLPFLDKRSWYNNNPKKMDLSISHVNYNVFAADNIILHKRKKLHIP